MRLLFAKVDRFASFSFIPITFVGEKINGAIPKPVQQIIQTENTRDNT